MISTIRVYLSGLRSWCIDQGLPLPEIYTPSLSQALRSLDRQHIPNQPKPILFNHLLAIMADVPFNKTNLMSLGAMFLAYFACLRPSEYLSTKGVGQFPARSDVTFTHDFSALDYTVRRSKTNPKGFIVHVGCSNSPVCAVCIIKHIIFHFPASATSPLFLSNSNTPITYTQLSAKLSGFIKHIGLDPNVYTLHSLRAGSATTAAAAGCSEAEIQKLGRWASLCYRQYIRPTREAQATLAPRLALSLSPDHFIS